MLKLMTGALAATGALFAAAYAAEPLDPSKPEDALKIGRKIQCSLVDAEPVTYWWHGRAYSRRQGERDKLLFLVEGMNVRACISDTHPERGEGYRLITKEILLYKDPKNGKVLRKWKNPWTGEKVDVLHVANDPVNNASYMKTRSGKDTKWTGEMKNGLWFQSATVPLFYKNPLASSFEAEIGGTYHATEMFNFFGNTEDLLDPTKNTATVQVSWERMSDWLPWMKMGGREGVIYMHTAGQKLNSWDELTDLMKDEIAKNYPDYTAPPPMDDQRKNVTSWSYYKEVMGEGAGRNESGH